MTSILCLLGFSLTLRDFKYVKWPILKYVTSLQLTYGHLVNKSQFSKAMDYINFPANFTGAITTIFGTERFRYDQKDDMFSSLTLLVLQI